MPDIVTLGDGLPAAPDIDAVLEHAATENIASARDTDLTDATRGRTVE